MGGVGRWGPVRHLKPLLDSPEGTEDAISVSWPGTERGSSGAVCWTGVDVLAVSMLFRVGSSGKACERQDPW